MDRRRLALIRSGDADGFRRVGTGYLIGPRLVLTTRHVVEESKGIPWAQIDVRVGHPQDPDVHRCMASVRWTNPEERDVALLLLDDEVVVPGMVRWGRPIGNTPLSYEGLGYPSATFKDRQHKVEHLRGKLPPQAGGVGAQDLYVLDQESAPDMRGDGEQAWSGASGSAVFCQDHLVGVVIHDDHAFANRRLHACPARTFTDDPAFTELLQRFGDGPLGLVDITAEEADSAGGSYPSIDGGPGYVWMGSWDGAADILTQSGVPDGHGAPFGDARLDSLAESLSRAVDALETDLARNIAERLTLRTVHLFGEGDPRTLTARHSLAFWTGHSGRPIPALRLTEELYEDCLESLGARHLLTRLAYLRLALWTGYTGDWHEARRLYGVVAHQERNGGDADDRLLLLAKWGRARALGRSGARAHAYEELDELLPEVIGIYGEHHPATFGARIAHAWAAGRAGESGRALGLLAALAEQVKEWLSEIHWITLHVTVSQAHWLWRTGRAEEALVIAKDARAKASALFGMYDPLTLLALETQAIALWDEEPDKATEYFRQVADSRERSLGAMHPETLTAQSNLAVARAVTEGALMALALLQKVVAGTKQVLGTDHPETLRTVENLAYAYSSLGRTPPALILLHDVHDVLRRNLGPAHKETARLAATLKALEEQLTSEDNDGLPSDYHYNLDSEGGGAASDRQLKVQIVPVEWGSQRSVGEDDSGNRDGQRVPLTSSGPVHGPDVLRVLADLPVSTWRYTEEDEEITHLGPMAQDWHALFGLGSDRRRIDMVDANGVAVVAIQALVRMVRNMEAKIAALEHRIAELSPDTPPDDCAPDS
ncbi:tetratricopeptide repeat protein [Streptomyces sp. NPDC059349]|uniref:tetratricopeptide repeat protein n=1 Tax=Streptomyces sp. NPDC059349 TaxID=3346808 RepID=UPI0036AF3FAE